MKRVIALLLLAAAAPGCTKVVVRRASDDRTPGLRYYLPQSFVIVTPNEDGSITARVESMADRSERYAVTAQSYMATHDFVMKVNQGLLTEVTLTKDTSAVAADAFKAAGEVGKSRIEAQIEADKAAREKKDEEAKKAREKQDALDEERRQDRRKLDQDIDAAKVNREKADAARKALPDTAEAKDKQAAEGAFQSADATVKELERQRTERFSSFSVVGGEKSPTTPNGFAHATRPGPVILRIAEDPLTPGVLQLVPISFDGPGGAPQKIFPAYTGVKAAEPAKAPAPKEIEFEQTAISVQVQNAPVSTTIQTKIDMTSLQAAIFKSPSGLKNEWKPTVKKKNSKTWELTFRANTPPETYTLTLFGKINKDDQDIPGKLSVTITP